MFPVIITYIPDLISSFWMVEAGEWNGTGCHPVDALTKAAESARDRGKIDEAESFERELEAWQNGERNLDDYLSQKS